MTQDLNFQDGLILKSDSLSFLGERIQIGTGLGAKSLVLSNNVGAVFFNANPTGNRSIQLPDAGGTVGLITALSAGAAAFTNGQLVVSDSNGISFGVNGSTLTASASSVPNMKCFWGREVLGNTVRGPASAFVFRLSANLPMNLTAFNILANNPQITSKTASVSFGLYSMNGSTATLLSSTSGSMTIQSAGATTNFAWITIPTGTMLVTQGCYMVYMVLGPTSAVSMHAFSVSGTISANTQVWFYDGVMTNTTNPNSFHVSEVTVTNSFPVFVALGS